MQVKDSKAPERSIPFVWPFSSDEREHDRDDQRVPIEDVLVDAGSIAGIVSDIDDEGVTRLEALLCAPDRKALIVLAVYAGCPTRSEHLARLLKFQERETAHTQFRILPMTVGSGAPSNCLTVVPKVSGNPICLFGATPNMGIPEHDPTQCNVAFRAEPALEDELCGWFNRMWAQAAPLTESTAKIPSLVPARGSADAAAQWSEYCKVCRSAEQDERTQREEESRQEETPATPDQDDQDDGESTQASASDKATDQSPSESIGLRRLDPLAERATRILGKGQQVTVVYEGAVKPLDVPISARFFDQGPEERTGTVVRRQTFRISAFSKEEQKMIDNHRKASRTVINKLGLPFEKGLYWMPNDMIPIFKKEIATAENEAKDALNRLVDSHAGTFVESKRMDIQRDLEETYRELDGEGDLPRTRLTEVLDQLERRIQDALESEIVTPVTFHTITVDLQSTNAHEAPWAQMEKLILALARFPRLVISKPKTLSGIATDRSSVLNAMNIEDDAILQVMKDSMNEAIRSSRWDLDQLERIADSDIEERDRCKVYLMIIDGRPNSTVQQFVHEKWSERREHRVKSS